MMGLRIGNPAMIAAQEFSLWPPTGSTGARDVDLVYIALLGLTAFFVLLIGLLALGFGVKYRAGTAAYRDDPIRRKYFVESLWITAPAVMTLSVFGWGAFVYVKASTPPADARTIYVVGKQWMWKVQHPTGPREINELHVPSGVPIKIVLTSQDVIHSFFIPAFRVKQDALPDRYTSMWFEATRPGEYHLFCAEYCGADHAQMRGRVVVMKPARFQQWLESEGDGGAAAAAGADDSRTAGGLFARFGCRDCHVTGKTADAPALTGLFGTAVELRDGRTVTVDENYIRRSLLEPNADIVAGYPKPSVMPTYKDQLSESEMAALVEYIKTLGPGQAKGESP